MGNDVGRARNGRSNPLLTLTSAVVLAATLLLGSVAPVHAQSPKGLAPAVQPPTPQWQIDAGGKMEFDVASVKLDTAAPSAQTVHSNVSLTVGDVYSPNGGLLRAADFLLADYLTFAYKMTSDQLTSLRPQLPKWAVTNRFDIEARAQGNPTKDQMRLMMQSLLADRFKLAFHYETRQLPVFKLVLLKPGKTGPQLQPHPADSPCSSAPPEPSAPGPAPAPPATVAGGFPVVCGGQVFMASAPGHIRDGGRNIIPGRIATILALLSGIGETGVDRPILDQTGLTGTFDFYIDFAPRFNGPLPAGSDFSPDTNGPTFLEAVQEQLGLKLEPDKGPVDVPVLDHIEEPSAN